MTFDFDRTPEQKQAELSRWDGIERRRTDPAGIRLRAEYDRDFRTLSAIYDREFPQRMTEWRRLNRQSDAVARLTDTENRENYLMPDEDRYPSGKALLLAVAASAIFWTVIYLIISGGQ